MLHNEIYINLEQKLHKFYSSFNCQSCDEIIILIV